ncbi:mitochondrial import receptor subunit TOM40 homolog 2-like [Drosophila bipectinata]|uniref:mitochondrial import receptor subunit TOM40 homolog 2-like n=1 Tax=Drosophila bipectinata TaxID=42026 RepID=UPI0038B366E4
MGNTHSNQKTENEKLKRNLVLKCINYVGEAHQEELTDDSAKIDVMKNFGDNPGNVSDLDKVERMTHPVCFDGFRIMSNRFVNPQLLLGNQLQMGKGSKNRYSFNFTYICDTDLHPLTGDCLSEYFVHMDSRSGFYVGMTKYLSDRLRFKSNMSFISEGLQHYQMAIDHMGRDYTWSCVLSDVVPHQNTGYFVTSYLKRITKRLDLGWDLLVQPGNKPNQLSFVGRYTLGPAVLLATLNSKSTKVTYAHTFNSCVRVGTQINANFKKKNSVLAKLYCHLARPQYTLNFRGAIDSRCFISVTCDKHLYPLPMSLILSARMNYRTFCTIYGVGIVVE